MRDGSKLQSSASELSTQIQVYAAGPQFLGFFLDAMGWGRSLSYGSTLLSSALSPVPYIGKGFRDSNGIVLYNRVIYGQEGIDDQIIPFQGELFINFHIAGVAGGFLLLGLFLGYAQRWFEQAGSAFAAYSIQYMSLWATMLILWSLAVFSQIMVYFCWPIYLVLGYGFILHWAERERARRLPRMARTIA